MKQLSVVLLLLFSGFLGFTVSWCQHRHQEIQIIQTFHYPTLFTAQLKNDPNAGKKIFKEFCATCHAAQPLIDLPAPRINDAKAWNVHRQKGIDVLLKMTISGIGAMPARGGCFECSDEQLRQTIEYILKVDEK